MVLRLHVIKERQTIGCYALRSKLSWTHHRLIMENEDARNYYLNEPADQNWSCRVLKRNILLFITNVYYPVLED